MATKKKPLTKASVEKSLTDQLEAMGASVDFYSSLVKDYMALWDAKEQLIKDIAANGVTLMEANSAGAVVHKPNTSVKDLVAVNKSMLTILDKLLITPELVGKLSEDDDL